MKVLTPIKSIREKCKQCCICNYKEIKECNIIDCPIWPYRMGKRPTPEEKKLYLDKKPDKQVKSLLN